MRIQNEDLVKKLSGEEHVVKSDREHGRYHKTDGMAELCANDHEKVE